MLDAIDNQLAELAQVRFPATGATDSRHRFLESLSVEHEGAAYYGTWVFFLWEKKRANLIRFHGVFAPNSGHRALITPAKRGKGNKREENCKTGDCESANRHAAMT